MTPQNNIAKRAHDIFNFANPLKKSNTQAKNIPTSPFSPSQQSVKSVVTNIGPNSMKSRKIKKCRDSYDFYFATQINSPKEHGGSFASANEKNIKAEQLTITLPEDSYDKKNLFESTKKENSIESETDLQEALSDISSLISNRPEG